MELSFSLTGQVVFFPFPFPHSNMMYFVDDFMDIAMFFLLFLFLVGIEF